MPWIYAAVAIGGSLINSASQNEAAGQNARQGALNNQQQSAPSFTPTAEAAQQAQVQNPSAAGTQLRAPEPTPGAGSGQPSAGSQPQTGGLDLDLGSEGGGGGSGAFSNVNQAVQLGTTLQQLFSQQQAQGQNARAQALAGSRLGPSQQFQPTALDPRLQQLLGG